jgi:hypothetical protein
VPPNRKHDVTRRRLSAAGIAVLLLLLVLCCWRWSTTSPTLQPAIAAQTTVHVGDRVAVRSSLALPWGQTAEQALGDSLPGGWQLVGGDITRQHIGFGLSTWAVSVVLQPYDLQPLATGELVVELGPAAGAGALRTALPRVSVAPRAEVAGLALLPLAGPVAPTLPPSSRPPTAVLLLVAAAAAVVIRRLIRRALAWPRPPSPPEVAAAAALAALRRAPTADSAATCIALADIVRRWLAAHAAIPATSLTTDELVTQLAASPLATEQQQQVRDVMAIADSARFTDSRPAAADVARALDLVEHMISPTAVASPS